MSRSLFLLAISVVAAGCSDDSSTTCGPGGAAIDGLTAGNGSDVSLTFENLSASQNHDCPDTSQTAVESITILGSRKGGNGLINFCIPRPDMLEKGNVQLGSDRNGDGNVNDRPWGVGRNTGRGFDYMSLDSRLTRTFRLRERMNVEAIAEAFNLLNRVNGMVPNTVITAPTFGRATVVNDARQMQLGLRLNF